MMHETKDSFLYPSLRVFSSLSSFSLIFFFGKNYSYFYFPCQQQRKRALQKHRLARTAVFAQPLSICFFYYLGAWNKLYHWFSSTNMITSIVQRAGLSLTAIKVLIWMQGLGSGLCITTYKYLIQLKSIIITHGLKSHP